jgi:hypothetical protein
MWGKPTSFFQKPALEANQGESRESRHSPCEEIADDEIHHHTDIAGFSKKSDVSRAKPISLGCTR